MTPSDSGDTSRRQLPIGIQSFRTIREEGYYYVDKTPIIRDLVERGSYYFLSRPRRFGKSLLLDTLKSLFEGHEELFRGLDIHDHWDWSVQYPVVRLGLEGKYNEPGEIERDIIGQLESIERHHGLPSAEKSGFWRLRGILDRLHHATGRRVVVLVDEYDKPILDVLGDPDLAKANRDWLWGFYGILKDSGGDIEFALMTGVSVFTPVGVFSGLNNLMDISLSRRYATICGYTDADLDTVFAPELPGLDRDEVRRWYNGYHWLGEEKVYNPFDVLMLFRNREFKPWWFETGSPEFLFRLLVEKEVSPMELEHRIADETLVSKFDVGDIGVDALLFQTGYLTIAREEEKSFMTSYALDYPNLAVRQSLNDGLLGYLGKTGKEVSDYGEELGHLLTANDFEGFADRLKSFHAGIPCPWQGSDSPGRHEAWHAGMLYACFRTIGLDLRVEESSWRGRADMVVFQGGQVFALEFRMAEDEGKAEEALELAIAQIRDRGYGEKYRDRGEPIRLVALVFGGAERNLLGVRAESA